MDNRAHAISETQEDTASEEPCEKTLPGSHIIWEVLLEEGVEVVFGYPGGAIMPAYDAMEKYPIHHVLVRHEQSAAHMADGYARASGNVGVAVATSGPGATNLVTGIANAMLDSVPVVFITGQVASHLIGTDAFQETDVSGVTLPITKHNYLVTRPEEIAPVMREAFLLARSGRQGPVLVDITKDAQQKAAAYTKMSPAEVVEPTPISGREEDPRIEAALDMIARARRPIIVAGQGIVKAEAAAELKEFVDHTDIPVAQTLLGLSGFAHAHPRSLGMCGMHGGAWVNQAIQNADLLLALGMRFDDRVTGNPSTFAANAKKIHVELDPSEINKNVKVELAIQGDVREVLSQLNRRLAEKGAKELGIKSQTSWLDEIASSAEDAGTRDIVAHGSSDKLLASHVIHDLWTLTEGNATISTDVGQHQMLAAQYYRHSSPRTLITSGGLGTMGFALPAAIGARFAQPEAEVWVIVGDGGVQMTSPELCTILQEGLKINVAIINNGYLGMVRQWQEMFFDRRYVSTPILAPDFVKLAEAYGHEGLRVTKRSEVEAAIQHARKSPNTVVIDFRVEADSVYPMVSPGASIEDMIRRPTDDAEDETP